MGNEHYFRGCSNLQLGVGILVHDCGIWGTIKRRLLVSGGLSYKLVQQVYMLQTGPFRDWDRMNVVKWFVDSWFARTFFSPPKWLVPAVCGWSLVVGSVGHHQGALGAEYNRRCAQRCAASPHGKHEAYPLSPRYKGAEEGGRSGRHQAPAPAISIFWKPGSLPFPAIPPPLPQVSTCPQALCFKGVMPPPPFRTQGLVRPNSFRRSPTALPPFCNRPLLFPNRFLNRQQPLRARACLSPSPMAHQAGGCVGAFCVHDVHNGH